MTCWSSGSITRGSGDGDEHLLQKCEGSGSLAPTTMNHAVHLARVLTCELPQLPITVPVVDSHQNTAVGALQRVRVEHDRYVVTVGFDVLGQFDLTYRVSPALTSENVHP